jgi:hypothetical protein
MGQLPQINPKTPQSFFFDKSTNSNYINQAKTSRNIGKWISPSNESFISNIIADQSLFGIPLKDHSSRHSLEIYRDSFSQNLKTDNF